MVNSEIDRNTKNPRKTSLKMLTDCIQPFCHIIDKIEEGEDELFVSDKPGEENKWCRLVDIVPRIVEHIILLSKNELWMSFTMSSEKLLTKLLSVPEYSQIALSRESFKGTHLWSITDQCRSP